LPELLAVKNAGRAATGTVIGSERLFLSIPGAGDIGNAKSEKCRASTTRQRLAEEKTCLEHLDAERAYRGDSGFGKTTEDRIVWSELLDLELQDIDEQVSRICQAAADASGPRSRMSNNSSKSRSK
jgi:hypothetical protein